MKIGPIYIVTCRIANRHAKVIAKALHEAEAIADSAFEREALFRLHNRMALAAEAMGIDLAPLSGGTPKPPREAD